MCHFYVVYSYKVFMCFIVTLSHRITNFRSDLSKKKLEVIHALLEIYLTEVYHLLL